MPISKGGRNTTTDLIATAPDASKFISNMDYPNVTKIFVIKFRHQETMRSDQQLYEITNQ
jgi:hypothetical protein